MNSTMTMASATQEDTLSFLAFPARKAASQVDGTTEDLFQNVRTILNQVLTDALTARTAEQFCATREKSIFKYMQVLMGLSKFINATVPETVIDRLTKESLAEMESDFRNEGVAAFGEYVTGQAMFTVFSLRKITDTVNHVCAVKSIDPSLVKDDRELYRRFLVNVMDGRFHLDCLIHSLQTSTPIFPEVLDSISEGLRAVVNAYAYVKRASDMRSGQADEAMIDIEFDEEEQILLESSTHDLQAMGV